MYKQLEYLREGITMTRGQTYRIDLPESGLLSFMFLKLSAPCTSGATLSATPWRLQDLLGRLEIIGNGATIIKSADYKHFDFLAWLKNGVSPMHAWRNYATNTQFEYLPLMFGRKLWDASYGLDLSHWDNVELRLTNSSSATYHSADITASILMGFMRDGGAAFNGYLRTELWRQWTSVADETKYFVLPSEFPISGLFLRALPDKTNGAADTNGANVMDDIDFSIGGGTKQVYKGGLDDLALINHYERGAELDVFGLADKTADYGLDISMLRSLGWAQATSSKDGAVAATNLTMTSDETDGTIRFETREADSPAEFIVKGYGYQNMAWLHSSLELEAGTLLDPKSDGEIRLNIHTQNAAAAADGTAEVVLERVVSG